MRFILATAVIALASGSASYAMAVRAVFGGTFVDVWFGLASAIFGVASVIVGAACFVRIMNRAFAADEQVDRDIQRLASMRARIEALDAPSAR